MTLAAKLFVSPLLAMALGLNSTLASVDVPNMTFISQEQGNWCWAASDQMILKHYNTISFNRNPYTVTNQTDQCSIANWAVPSNCGVPGDCCSANYSNCNQQCPDQITNFFSHIVDVPNNAISWQTITGLINGQSPFIIQWGWPTGGSHIMVGVGYSSNTVRVFDPMQGRIGIPFSSIFLQGTEKIRTNFQ